MSLIGSREASPNQAATSHATGRVSITRLTRSANLGNITVAVFAVGVVCLTAVLAFFVDRSVGVEEIVLFNAAYMFAHTGKVALPVYSFEYGPRLFETMGIHPHVHYAVIGALLRAGFDIRVAEGLPITTMALLTAVLLVTSRVANPVKLGALFGFAAALAVALVFLQDEVFSARPEFDVTAAWLAGVVALETGRRASWDVRRLALGAFLMTYASGLQWFAIGGFLGVAIYFVCAVRELGMQAARTKLLAMVAGGMGFGLPYVALFILPNWDIISRVIGIGWNCGNCGADPNPWAANAIAYKRFEDIFRPIIQSGRMLATLGPIEAVLAMGAPPFMLGIALLLLPPSTRVMSLAAAALPLWAYLAANHKDYYYFPEFLLLLLAIGVVVAYSISVITRWITRGHASWLGTLIAVVALASSLATGTPELQAAKFVVAPSPMDVARAAGKAIVGPGALVATQHQLWYIAGARYWHDFRRDVITSAQPPDEVNYFGQFDAVAETPYSWFSLDVLKRAPRSSIVPAMYAAGQLKLLGFYSDAYSYAIFDDHGAHGLRAFLRRGRLLYEFESAASATHMLVTLVCPLDAAQRQAPPVEGLSVGGDVSNLAFNVTLSEMFVPLPQDGQALSPSGDVGTPGMIRGLILPVARYASELTALTAGCTVRDELAGSLSVLDAYDFGRGLQSADRTVTPFFAAAEAVAARQGDSSRP